MKLPILKKIQKEDLQTGEDLPKWVDRMLTPVNQFIEQVGIAITGRLSFGDNMAGKFTELRFVHDVEQELNPNDSRAVIGVIPVFAEQDLIVGYGWRQLANGNISVTLQLDGASADAVLCRVLLLFR